MTVAPALRVPRKTPIPSPNTWFQFLTPPAAYVGADLTQGATYYNGKTYLGYADGDGNVRVATYNHTTHAIATSPAIVSGLTPDLHVSPSVLLRQSDHKVVIAVMKHGFTDAYVAISTNAEDISAWGAATNIGSSLSGTAMTYAHLAQLSGESGKMYLFYRDTIPVQDGTFAFSTSTDGGATWAAETILFENTGNACYGIISSDDTNRIDFAVSDGNAGDGEAASIYHFYYTGGSYYKTDGTLISASLPLVPSNLTKIYDSSNGWAVGPNNIVGGANPVVTLTAYNVAGSGSNQNYWYCIYTGGSWSTHTIDSAGSPPDPNFGNGGTAADRIDPTKVYVSKKTGTYAWQMYLYQTANNGVSWTNTAMTFDPDIPDSLNLEPIAPHNAASGIRCFWQYGPHYHMPVGGVTAEPPTEAVRGYPNPIGPF